MTEILFFGIKVNPLLRSEFLNLIETGLKDGKQLIQNGLNAASVNELVINEDLKQAYKNSDLINIDGMSVVWTLRFLGYDVPERVACPDLADDILAMAEKNNYSVFLFGAKERHLLLSIECLNIRYPNLKIAGFRNGYYRKEDEAVIINLINCANPDILFLGMPSPCKELFVEQYRHDLKAKYILGVGGYFDIVSGLKKRAPKWIQNIGLEWSYRLLQEPSRMFYRYIFGNINFIWLIFQEKLRRIKY